MSLEKNEVIGRTLIIIILYLLQGYIHAFKTSIPLFLASCKASWQQQGIFSWVSYPFSFKILWAPIIESIYIDRFGRYLTWLVPIQTAIGAILVVLSFYLESLLVNLQIVTLTVIYFVVYFLIASQDIVVDGWSVALFASSNLQWASTCQTLGQDIGHFLGSTVLMTLESSNFTNRYIREPFSLPHRSSGLFSLQQFTFFWGILFIVISVIIVVVFFGTKPSKKKKNVKGQKKIQPTPDLFETYLDILKLFKKPCMRELALILLTFDVGFAATNHMTILALLEYGIARDTLVLLKIPLVVVNILVPLCMSKIRQPLRWFARGYILRLFTSLILAIYIFFTLQILHTSYFYLILIVLLGLNEAFLYIMIVSRVGFCARISEPRIAGTYMTLLAALSNLGYSLLSTLVFYIANWLPRSHAYSIEVGICLVLGSIWIRLFWHTIRRLERLPVQEWYLEPYNDANVSLYHEYTIKCN